MKTVSNSLSALVSILEDVKERPITTAEKAELLILASDLKRNAGDFLQLPKDGAYIIKFDDKDREDEFFAMNGAREAALERYRNISYNWNAHLFVKIDSNDRNVEEFCPSAKYSLDSF